MLIDIFKLVTFFNVTLWVVSDTMTRVNEIIVDISRRKKAISCNGSTGLLVMLEELGFMHKAGKTEGHRVFVHPKLSKQSDFKTHSVDCGHKPNRNMKFQYVVNTIGKLRQYQSELEVIYEQNSLSS